MNQNSVFFPLTQVLSGWFRGSKQRTNAWFNQRTNQVNKGKIYEDTSVPYDLYNTIPQLRVPIDKLAAMFSNGQFVLKNVKDGEKQPLTPELETLFKKPNVMQDQNTWLKQYLVQLIVYGNQFMYINTPSRLTKVPKSIINLSHAYCKPVLSGKFFDQIDMESIVDKYEYNDNLVIRDFETKSIIWSRIPDLDHPVKGESPLKSIKFPLTNTKLAYQYLNVISSEKGNIGILSQQTKDSMGAIPMTPQQKQEIEAQYRNNNGIEDDQQKILITSGSVSWQPMTYPTRDLLLTEQIDANFLTILNVLGVNQNLFVNSTYENLKHGLIQTHNDTVVPYADGFTQSLNEKFKDIIPAGFELKLDYSHLPYLQENKAETATTYKTISEAVEGLVTTGIITATEAKDILAKYNS